MLLGIEGNDIYLQSVAHLADLRGGLDAAPAQLGDMYHAVHAADVNKDTVRSHGLDGTGVVLAHLDAGPDLLLSSLAGLLGDGADGAHHTAAVAVDLGHGQLNLLLDHGAQVRTAGLAALRSRHEDLNALDGNDNATLVLSDDNTLHHGLVLHGLLDVLPDLDGLQTLSAQLGIAFHVVDAHDHGLNLIVDMNDILGLGAGVVGQLAQLNVSGLLGAHIHLDLGGGNGSNDSGYPVACI